jgi:hypothetical protein
VPYSAHPDHPGTARFLHGLKVTYGPQWASAFSEPLLAYVRRAA